MGITIEELKAIKEKTLKEIEIRLHAGEDHKNTCDCKDEKEA